jgi:aspartyl-tRNA(Asn)/glutamyl-tRNA(Gln) amidotransferase subunit B
MRYSGTCDGNMQEGSLRADVNVSVRKKDQKEFGTRCEIKNVNSIKFMQMAIDYEANRQVDIIEEGGTIDQETRLFDIKKNETRSMRLKEDAHDYRYFLYHQIALFLDQFFNPTLIIQLVFSLHILLPFA